MRRVVLVWLALVVCVPSAARASAWYRCAGDGETRAACCCPPAVSHHPAPARHAEVHAACCCSVTQISAHASAPRAAPPIALDVAPAVVAVAIVTAPIEPPARVAPRDDARLRRGPPDALFARFCSRLL